MKSTVFEYGGYHFVPERQLTAQESSLYTVSRKLRIDRELGLCREGYAYKSKFNYSHNGFYAAATDKDCDLFRCMENGELYIPCQNDLQEYMELQKKGRDRNERRKAHGW